MLTWLLFVTVIASSNRSDSLHTQVLYLEDRSSCIRAGERIIKASSVKGNHRYTRATYSCTQVYLSRK